MAFEVPEEWQSLKLHASQDVIGGDDTKVIYTAAIGSESADIELPAP